jgi:predicted nucleotidyltransferase
MMNRTEYATDRPSPAMRRADILAKLKKAEPALRRVGVDALYLFGSIARDDAREGSDVDVFIDPESDESFGFLQYMDAYDAIRRAIGGDVEIGYSTRTGLSRYVRAGIEREAIRVF